MKFLFRSPFYLFLVVAALMLFALTSASIGGGNDASRIATIEALVERGVWWIEGTGYRGPDWVFRNNHFFSSKPPTLSFLMSFAYLLMYPFGIEINTYDLSPQAGYYILTLLFSGGSFIAAVWLIYAAAKIHTHNSYHAFFLAISMAFGTLLFPYALTINNHIVAAALVSGMWYMIIRRRRGASPVVAFFAGIFSGGAAIVDVIAGSIAAAWAGVYFLFLKRDREGAIWFTAGLIPPVFFHSFLNISAVNTVLPAYFHKAWSVFPGSYWGGEKTAIDAVQHPRWLYAFNALVGTHGIFLYTPLLFLSVWSAVRAWRKKKEERDIILLIAGACVSVILFIIFLTNNYGGFAYGMRWFIPVVPLLMWPLVYAIQEGFISRHRIVFGALFGISILFAAVGFVNPWSNFFLIFPDGTRLYFPFLGNIIQVLYQVGLL